MDMPSAMGAAELPPENQRVGTAPELDSTDYEILNCLAEGLSNAAIAQRLHYAQSTIKNRVSRLLRQFGVESRTALIAVWLTREEGSPNGTTLSP